MTPEALVILEWQVRCHSVQKVISNDGKTKPAIHSKQGEKKEHKELK